MLKTYRGKLIEKKPLAAGVFLFVFGLEEPKEITFNPGQYIILDIPQKEGGRVKRLYSIASSPERKKSFELIVRCIRGGIGSDYLRKLKIGEKVVFQGPAGTFVLKENNNEKVFLATGTGIAPIRSMISQLKGSKVKYYLFWGLRYYKDIYLFNEFKDLAERQPNFSFWICLSREENMNNIPKEERKHFVLGRVNIGLEKLIKAEKKKINRFDFYICGSRHIVGCLQQDLLKKGIKKEKIYFERF